VVDAAVIFDVDGVLLDATEAEEDCLFGAFEALHGIAGLSRDWDSYRVRNDDDIIAEVLERHFARPASEAEKAAIRTHYLAHLAKLKEPPVEVPGAADLLDALIAAKREIGIATANLLAAARQRLERAKLWSRVSRHAAGADGGGHKSQVLARVIASTGLRKHRIIYVGDNLNDVQAAQENGVYFIGFVRDATKRRQMIKAGARIIATDHEYTLTTIRQILG
jgi:HAD superfamily hydrolase (TIGR01549 family)